MAPSSLCVPWLAAPSLQPLPVSTGFFPACTYGYVTRMTYVTRMASSSMASANYICNDPIQISPHPMFPVNVEFGRDVLRPTYTRQSPSPYSRCLASHYLPARFRCRLRPQCVPSLAHHPFQGSFQSPGHDSAVHPGMAHSPIPAGGLLWEPP